MRASIRNQRDFEEGGEVGDGGEERHVRNRGSGLPLAAKTEFTRIGPAPRAYGKRRCWFAREHKLLEGRMDSAEIEEKELFFRWERVIPSHFYNDEAIGKSLVVERHTVRQGIEAVVVVWESEWAKEASD